MLNWKREYWQIEAVKKEGGIQMASGDPQRQWFPEMIEALREQWNPEFTWNELVHFAEQLDATLQGIRKERNLLPPMFYCPACGKHERSKVQRISVNATILAAGRFEICSVIEAKELSKRWAKHRKTQNIDRYGRQVGITQDVVLPI